MYERSAIVLERYLQTTLGYRKRSNIKTNYKNYCKLIENVEAYQAACVKEKEAAKDFNTISEEITDIQTRQSKLYKKGGKLEYNRNIIFDNIEADPDEIEKCVEKIEASIEKNSVELVELRKAFIDKIREYAIRKQYMQVCKEAKKDAEIEYKETLLQTIENVQKIDEGNIDFVKRFISSDNEETKKDLARVMAENGEGEKNPFDTDVITTAVALGMDVAKKEAEAYLFIFEKTEKLLADIEKRLIEINRYKRWARDITVKLNFLTAEKEYLVQFLDYERITVIHPKRTYKSLMQEACQNLEADVVQINNLYELILREISGKSTKKGYKQLYNKSYLAGIEQTEVDFEKEKDKININAVTLINSNYWRIEGIKNIYTVFYKDVSEVYGKDLAEFDLPKEEQVVKEETVKVEEVKNEVENIENLETSEENDPVDMIFEKSTEEQEIKSEDNQEEVEEDDEDELIFIDTDEDDYKTDFIDDDEEEDDDEIQNINQEDNSSEDTDEDSLFGDNKEIDEDELKDEDLYGEDEYGDDSNDSVLDEKTVDTKVVAFEKTKETETPVDTMAYLGLEPEEINNMLNEEVDFDELRKIKKRKFFEKLSQMNKRGKREVN